MKGWNALIVAMVSTGKIVIVKANIEYVTENERPIIRCSVLTRPILNKNEIFAFTNDTIKLIRKNSFVSSTSGLIVSFEYPSMLSPNEESLRVACQINSTKSDIIEKEEEFFTKIREKQCVRNKPNALPWTFQSTVKVEWTFNSDDFVCIDLKNVFLHVIIQYTKNSVEELMNLEYSIPIIKKSIEIKLNQSGTPTKMLAYYIYPKPLKNHPTDEYTTVKVIKIPNGEKVKIIIGAAVSGNLLLLLIVLIVTVLYLRRSKKRKYNKYLVKEFMEYENFSRSARYESNRSVKLNSSLLRKKEEDIDFSKLGNGEPIKLKDISKLINLLEMANGRGFRQEYNSILNTPLSSMSAGQELKNCKKNRYTNVIPYDHNRVILNDMPEGYERDRKFIACQGPLRNTLQDFWRMVWQEDVKIIVMLCRLYENKMRKCEKYWREDSHQWYGELSVSHSGTTKLANYFVRTFKITKGNAVRNVEQYHYDSWPDHGVPSNPTAFMDFWNKIKLRLSSTNSISPVLVHCSAGVGRTGTFIALDNLVHESLATRTVSIKKCVENLRNDRVLMVQTPDQYIFVYYTLFELSLYGTTTVSCKEFDKKFLAANLKNSAIFKEYDFLSKRIPQIDMIKECKVAMHTHCGDVNEILPRDSERIVLKSLVEERGDYINAIPVPSEVEIWSNLSLVEPFIVKIKREKVVDKLLIRDLEVSWSDMVRQVRHVQFLCWNKDATTPGLDDLTNVTKEVKIFQQGLYESRVVVYCSDGVKRSATFCILNAVLERIDLDREVNIFQASRQVAELRPQVISTLESYKDLYKLISKYLQAHSDYANYE
ncbi:DgyrCDS3073 [Dimorphilus gyrociliatus]|uniref:DgyrCDS3073 n=1 Tax=Dimorphilus gyrociliatus TaxID=2664684 RepID=A0A7I8VE00_9ANNE|nr:DgyrCDS3073 [Dimorphilus gyrociliatus]